jgi:hypothetical protein
MPFMTTLRAEKVGDGCWTLLEPLVYRSLLTGKTYTVPAGFTTDFASVPRLPLVFLLAGDTAHTAAVVHDYLYRTGYEWRAVADEVFKEAMEAEDVPGWQRWLMYAGVRVGGWSAYKGGKNWVPAHEPPIGD